MNADVLAMQVKLLNVSDINTPISTSAQAWFVLETSL